MEDFQRQKLWGFTTRELIQLNAISTSSLKPASLENVVIPLLSKQRWEKTPPDAFTRTSLYPLENGEGVWIMDNPVVERVMEPILRLASRILISSHMLPWVISLSSSLVISLTRVQFNALMDGERRPIPRNRVPARWDDITNALSFHATPNFDQDATALRRDQVFHQLVAKWKLTFGFQSSAEDIRGPHFDDEAGNELGCTLLNLEQMDYDQHLNPQWGIWIYITYNIIEQLFRDDLNDADRMCSQWAAATTVNLCNMNIRMCLC